MKHFCQLFSLTIFLYLLTASQTQAQIVPDATLPNSSIVTPDGNGTVITGGTQAGSNLFHSFQEFSLPRGTAYFNNPLTIDNIISRVTGKNISEINGLIRANGTANLFLLNPNGIIFGSNASLNIGGSFFATTADSIKFADGTIFSAVKPDALLTISVPVGLQFGQKPGEIQNASIAPLINFSTGNPIIDEQSGEPYFGGLQVIPGKTLALVGGPITFAGGVVTVEDGRIELGSVGDSGFVSLIPIGDGWTLGYEGVKNFQDIQFSDSATLDVSGASGGSIQVQGGQVTLTGGSVFGSNTLENDNKGEIRIEASQLKIDDSLVFSTSNGSGKAADITVETKQLIITNGGQIFSKTYGSGQTGNLSVTASDFIQTSGGVIINETWNPSGLFTQVSDTATGNGGKLTITTNNLKIVDGAQITTTTFGSGNAGLMDIKASQVDITGSAIVENGELFKVNGLASSSGLYSGTEENSTGKGGDLILTGSRVILSNGGILQTATFGSGDAGNLTVKASDFIEVIGTDAEGLFPSSLFAASGGITGVTAGVTQATGKGGDINIETRELRVLDGAAVAVGSINPNDNAKGAGNLTIQAEAIALNNGRLVAETASGNGGNINLQLQNLLLLRNNSQISTSAGTQQKGGNGGNITIDAPFIVAVPSKTGDGNDITAQAYTGNGGNITFKKPQGIFGISERRTTPGNATNDIDASSEFGTQGTVTINQPDIDPSRGLIPLPSNVVDASGQIATGCTPGSRQRASSFVASGRGGIAPSPTEPLIGDAVIAEWVTIPSGEDTGRGGHGEGERGGEGDTGRGRNFSLSESSPSSPIVEAQGWIVDGNGDIFLVASAPKANFHSSWHSLNCEAR